MGLALVLSDVSFADANLGRVTPVQDIPVTALSINAPDTIVGSSYQLVVGYTPSNTSQRGVSWSVTSGSQYASVDNAGLLTINSAASSNNVTIRVTSTANSSVYAEKTITVTWESGQPNMLTGAEWDEGHYWKGLSEKGALSSYKCTNVVIPASAKGTSVIARIGYYANQLPDDGQQRTRARDWNYFVLSNNTAVGLGNYITYGDSLDEFTLSIPSDAVSINVSCDTRTLSEPYYIYY